MFIKINEYLINTDNITHIDTDFNGDVRFYFNVSHSVQSVIEWKDVTEFDPFCLIFSGKEAETIRQQLNNLFPVTLEIFFPDEEPSEPDRILGHVEKYFEEVGNEPPGPESDDIPF